MEIDFRCLDDLCGALIAENDVSTEYAVVIFVKFFYRFDRVLLQIRAGLKFSCCKMSINVVSFPVIVILCFRVGETIDLLQTVN